MDQNSEWTLETIEEIKRGLEKLLKVLEEIPFDDDDKERDYGV